MGRRVASIARVTTHPSWFFGLGFSLCLVAPFLFAVLAASATADSGQELEYSPLLDQGLLGEGRQAYRERADLDRAQDAYDLFKRNLDENPGDPIAAWHFSLSCYYVGQRGTGGDSEARSEFMKRAEWWPTKPSIRTPNVAPAICSAQSIMRFGPRKWASFGPSWVYPRCSRIFERPPG